MSSQAKAVTPKPWGRISAGTLGGLLLALAVGVSCSVFWPSDPFDRMFMGALLFPGVWVTAMCTAFTAHTGKQAWLWVGVPTLLFTALATTGLFLFKQAV
ncbi:hypothetical protein [Acanthopleuribacter pedis]|uniref:Uncharacterized protein n=1 Tax=Acanthopleuribacter pedis TaxID=442870 RepID=A0A8J7U2Q1_9BACT|nr:hypothetical protein [Acanthopleuribacter pedis]MBO1317503.1 hypothetical protein [Acanthopleuribacter pedis]